MGGRGDARVLSRNQASVAPHNGERQLAYPEFAAFFSKKPLIWPMGVKEEPPPTRPRPPARSLPLPESEEADAAQKVDSRQHSIKSGEQCASNHNVAMHVTHQPYCQLGCAHCETPNSGRATLHAMSRNSCSSLCTKNTDRAINHQQLPQMVVQMCTCTYGLN